MRLGMTIALAAGLAFTDDAAIAEWAGMTVTVVAGGTVVRVTNESWRVRNNCPRSKGCADEAASSRVRGADDRC